MEKETVKTRWFLIKHECGSIFTVNTERFFKVRNEQEKALDYVNYDLRCPSCQKTIHEDIVKMFCNFIKTYKALIESFSEEGFTLREVSNQDLNFLLSQ